MACVDLVDGRGILCAYVVDCRLDELPHRRPRFRQRAGQVQQRLFGLGRNGLSCLPGDGINAEHAGTEDQSTGSDGLAI